MKTPTMTILRWASLTSLWWMIAELSWGEWRYDSWNRRIHQNQTNTKQKRAIFVDLPFCISDCWGSREWWGERCHGQWGYNRWGNTWHKEVRVLVKWLEGGTQQSRRNCFLSLEGGISPHKKFCYQLLHYRTLSPLSPKAQEILADCIESKIEQLEWCKTSKLICCNWTAKKQ